MKFKKIQKLLVATAGALICLLIETNTAAADHATYTSNRVIDLAGNGTALKLLFTPDATNNQFRGTIGSGRAYLYKGGTLNDSDCTPLGPCGVVASAIPGEFVPEFPDEVIGHLTLQIQVITDEFDDAFTALLARDFSTYLSESAALSRRIVFEVSGIFNFNDSSDYLVPGKDTLTIHGYMAWGLHGERFNLAVTGGTGKFKKARGVVELNRLIVANASGAQSLRIRLPKFR